MKCNVTRPIRLRSEPIENLGLDELREMLRANDFYDSTWHKAGKGIHHEYEPQTINGNMVIIDHTTGLMWQRSGSTSSWKKEYERIKNYIKDMNAKKFAGFSDWRLPTLEEAMSLMKPTIESYDLHMHIDPLFYKTRYWILFYKKILPWIIWMWTADKYKASYVWHVTFYDGHCFYDDGVEYFQSQVRAVRSY